MDENDNSSRENPFASCLTWFADGCTVVGCLSGFIFFVGIPAAVLLVRTFI
ncbi:hypothetical protein [Pontibacillus salipaludis]|uniref:hypothetical protein n=1 Tax=Pontibacillus salipaludis TaxID=1697394 RepID=UPI00166D4AF4|nr:hypothetical protein [Pontibacillus salipaludis]